MSEIPQLTIGEEIVGGRCSYKVDKKLGEGGFGGVYLVSNGEDKYAMKIESANEKMQCLKMDVIVLSALQKSEGRHVCRIQDKGRNATFNYCVMTLVGQSLSDLRKACPAQKFSLPTALMTGVQCLEAIEDIHKIGYLHRDIKPANFAIGREETGEQRKIFILDFGMCRKFTDENGNTRMPRRVCGFRGTIRYAPLSCHLGRELARKDDIEIWFYQQIELTVGKLPWHTQSDKEEVQRSKERLRSTTSANADRTTKKVFAECPKEYKEMLDYVDKLKYFDVPAYGKVYTLLNGALANAKASPSAAGSNRTITRSRITRGAGSTRTTKQTRRAADGIYDWEKSGKHFDRTQMLPAPGYDPHKDAGQWTNW